MEHVHDLGVEPDLGPQIGVDDEALTELPLGGQHAANNDFAETRPASISGSVFHDRDNDGVIDEDADYDAVLHDIRETLENVPGYVFQVKQFLRERMDEVLTGTTADVVVRVVGPDLTVLRSQANKIAETIEGIDGVSELRTEQQVEVPQVEVLLRPREAAEYAFSVGGLNREIQTRLKGQLVKRKSARE